MSLESFWKYYHEEWLFLLTRPPKCDSITYEDWCNGRRYDKQEYKESH